MRNELEVKWWGHSCHNLCLFPNTLYEERLLKLVYLRWNAWLPATQLCTAVCI